MAIVNQDLYLEITPGTIPPILNVTEYDENMRVTVHLRQRGQEFEIPSGTTAKVEGTLAGHPFSADTTPSGSNVTFELTKGMTAYAGRAWTKIKLTKDGKPVSTCGFWLDCDRAGVEADTVIGAPGFEEQIKAAVASVMDEKGIGIDDTLTVSGSAADAKVVGDLFRAAERSANNVVAKYTDADTIFTSPANSTMYIIAERYPAGYIDHIDIYNADAASPFTLIEMFDSDAVCIGKFNAQITGAGWQSIPIKTFFGEEIYIGVSKTGLGFTRRSNSPKSYYTISFNTAYNNIDIGSVAEWTAHDGEVLEIGVKAVYTMSAPYSKGSVNNKLGSIDFNDLVDGYYFVNATENDNNPCINAPLSLTRGYFVVMCFRITDGYYMQFCQTSSNSGTDYDWSVHGLWFRYFSTSGAVEGIWQEAAPRDIINNKFVACGDSITAGFLRTVDGVNTYTTYKWPKEVARSLGLVLSAEATSGAGYLYERSGKSGIIVADNTDWTLYDLVTFAYGTNDWGNNMELGSISDTYPDNNTVYAAIKHCVETIITANPSICLIMITPIQRFRSGQTVENDYSYGSLNAADTPYTLSDVCQAIVDVAKMYHLPYIDNRDGCVINTLNVRARTVDGLHPTDRGYIMLGQYYAAKIGAIFKSWVW